MVYLRKITAPTIQTNTFFFGKNITVFIVSVYKSWNPFYQKHLKNTKFSDRVQAYHFGKNDFELGVGGEGHITSQNFEGGFGSKGNRAKLL